MQAVAAEEFLVDCASYLGRKLLEERGLGLGVTLVKPVTHVDG